MEFEAAGRRWPEQRGDASEAAAPTPERVEACSPRFDSSRALRLLKELGTNVTEDLVVLMPNLLSFLKHGDPAVVKQSIASGTNLFAAVLEQMALQINGSGKVDAWLEEMWSWMVQFKEAVRGMMHELYPVATKLLAVKFLETCVLCFTPQANNDQIQPGEGKSWLFDTSRLVRFHPCLDLAVLEADASRSLSLLLDILQSAYAHRGSFLVAVINCLAAIAKNRPNYYDRILPALLGFDPSLETAEGAHSASLRYALKAAFLGFLRCPHPAMIESKDRLVRRVRALSPGDATEQVIRQVEKMSRNSERASRASKDDTPVEEIPSYGDLNRKRLNDRSSDVSGVSDGLTKRPRFDTAASSNPPVQRSYDMQCDDDANMGSSSNAALLNSDLSPVEKMIGMIGALLAEGERGAESLDILISTVGEDLMADIVIETMKHLPDASFPLSMRNGGQQTNFESTSSILSELVPAISQSAPLPPQFTPTAASSSGVGMLTSDEPAIPSVHADAKRDPRRDPRRLDPRRMVSPAAPNTVQAKVESTVDVHQTSDICSNTPSSFTDSKVERDSGDLLKSEDEQLETSLSSRLVAKDTTEILDGAHEKESNLEVPTSSEIGFPQSHVDQETANPLSSEITVNDGLESRNLEFDPFSSPPSKTSTSEDAIHDLPMFPSHLELSDEDQMLFHKLAVGRIIDHYKSNNVHARFSLLARLIAQSAADDNIIELVQKHVVFDYHRHKGHELAMHVLYQLQTVMIADPQEHSSFATCYEKFFVSIARSLIDLLPASDKSFGKLLGEAPYLPDCVLKLLEDLCESHSNGQQIKDSDGDRVTQGLGTVWSLILGRPPVRQACLDIALKCAIHSQDDVRAKAVRLVANKLYLLTYASEKIEQFATDMLLALVDKQVVETETSSKESKAEFEAGCQETSVSGSQNSEAGISESGSFKSSLVSPKPSAVSPSQAQCHTSLFFALCTKKPSLLRHLFNIYGRAPKVVKQSIHRHIPVLMRNMGSSYSELLDIIHNLPEGSEHLVTLILQILSEESNPSSDLIEAVKHIYQTKLKDVSILVPLLSSFPKEEVLPIFPRLVDLPPERFQAALARILQGSAHTGPALTPAEVLIAIHDINPEKDKVALKKVTDACTACFEQRTVFTQQVLEKSLSWLVDKVPIPLLFMRTVIQAVDAFPALVDFVMGILSRLVTKQEPVLKRRSASVVPCILSEHFIVKEKIWKMPKLWVGFLKLAYQTQPHSFHVLLQLPPPQLENALNKYPNLRAPLASYVNQQNVHSTLSRQTLNVLGFVTEMQQATGPFVPAGFQAPDSNSSLHGATLT